MRGILGSMAGTGNGQGDYQAVSLLGAVLENHAAAMLGDDLLGQRNSDSVIKSRLAVEWEEKLTFIERFGVKTNTTDLDDHVTVVDGGVDG